MSIGTEHEEAASLSETDWEAEMQEKYLDAMYFTELDREYRSIVGGPLKRD